LPKPGFFNDNANRAYPFLEGTAGVATPEQGPLILQQLPNGWIVDCGFTVSPDYGGTVSALQIKLVCVRRQSGKIYFEFATVSGETVIFSRTVGETEYLTEYQDSNPTSQSEYVVGRCHELFVTGYLITGALDDVDKYLAEGASILAEGGECPTVDPTLVQLQGNAMVLGFRVGNDDRTRYEAPTECDPVEWPYGVDEGVLHMQPDCLAGPVRLKPGFNCQIRQSVADNSLTIAAVVGAGEGQPCQQIQLSEKDVPPIGSTNGLREGGILCNEAIRTINGRGGPRLTIMSTQGVSVTSVSAEHRLVIDVNLNDMVTCYRSPDDESQS